MATSSLMKTSPQPPAPDEMISLRIPRPLRQWARVEAAKHDQTMSQFIRHVLEERRRSAKASK